MTRKEEIARASKDYHLKRHPNFTFGEYVAFIDGAEWADAHPHWISVDDELPKEHEWILGFSLKRSYIDVYNFDSNGLFEAHDITHWMPLPQTPKKGGEE